MKISSQIILCLLVLSLFSCSQDKGKKGRVAVDGKAETETIHTDNGQEILTVEEDFEQFILKFNTLESFQLERIKFPIKVIIPNTEHEGMAPMEETIGKYDWEFLDLTYDSTYLTRPIDQYYQGIRFKRDTAIVEIRGINNGIYADYYFTLIDNKWYLVTLYEASF